MIPALTVELAGAFEFNTIKLSSILTSSVLSVVTLPKTDKLPLIEASPSTVKVPPILAVLMILAVSTRTLPADKVLVALILSALIFPLNLPATASTAEPPPGAPDAIKLYPVTLPVII